MGAPILSLDHKEAITSLVVTSCSVFAGGDMGAVFQWWLGNGETQHILEGHRSQVASMLLVDDGNLLSNSPCPLMLHAPSPAPAWLDVSEASRTAALLITAGFDDKIRVWDILGGHCRFTIRSHSSRVSSLIRAGELIVSASWDMTIQGWSLKNGELDFVLAGHTDSVKCLALTQDGTKLLSGSRDKTVRVWDLKGVGNVCGVEDDDSGKGNGKKGKRKAKAKAKVKGKDEDGGGGDEERKDEEGGGGDGGDGEDVGDGEEGEGGGERKKKWRRKKARRRKRKGKTRTAGNATISIAAAKKAVTKLLEAPSRQLTVLSGHEGDVVAVHWESVRKEGDEQDLIITLALDPMIRVFSLASGQLLHTLAGHMHFPLAAIVRPHLIFTSSADTSIGIFDYRGGDCLRMLPGHEASVRDLALYQKRLISASRDHSIVVWDFEAPGEDELDMEQISLRLSSYDDVIADQDPAPTHPTHPTGNVGNDDDADGE